MKIRLNDFVIVLTGKDKGKTGSVTKVLQKEQRIVIEGVNRRVKHVRGREGQPGERVEFDAPIHVSNVAISDPKTGKATRIGYIYEGNQKIRIAKKSGEVIVAGKAKKKPTKTSSKKSSKTSE
ncbi:50S ribosomal protein L24 [Candidatus Gracilibacteria bacterium]|nr:50S ribosomal protein L24 [Candidatus Gracilibacteria bacterium]